MKRLSTLPCVTFIGGSITTFEDNGRLGTDCWATDSAHPAVLSWLRLHPTLSISFDTYPDALEPPLVSSSFRRLCSLSASALCLSFSRARSCCRRRSSSSCCIFRRNSCCCCCCCKRNSCRWRQSLFPHAPVLTPTADLAVFALFFSQLLGFRAPFRQSVAFLMIASLQY